MTQKPKLSAGQRVRVYWNDDMPDLYCDGKILNISNEGLIQVEGMPGTWFDPKITKIRKLRPKQKPEKERERLECWTNRKEFHRIPSLDSGFPFVSRAQLIGDQYAHLVELKPGQVVLGREELARAWDEKLKESAAFNFDALAEALGLGKDKA